MLTTSRVENGHTVPSIDTLQKYAQALRNSTVSTRTHDGEEAHKRRRLRGLDLDGKNLSLSERREIESLGRQFTKKLKARDKGELVRLLVAKLAQSAL